MKLLVTITIAAGLAGASPALALDKNRAELNFGSTHPGTVTGFSLLGDDRPDIILTDDLPGIASQDRLLLPSADVDRFRDGETGFDDLPPGFSLDRRIPSKK